MNIKRIYYTREKNIPSVRDEGHTLRQIYVMSVTWCNKISNRSTCH